MVSSKKLSAFICVYLWLILLSLAIEAQTLAPGAPGKDAQWASAGKQGVGTSASLESKIWFTLQGGAMTEVYYPDVTVANVHLLQFVVVNPKTKKVETERDDAIQKLITEEEYYGGILLTPFQSAQLSRQLGLPVPKKIKPEDKLIPENSLQFIQRNTAKTGKWKISKRYITDVENNTVLIRVMFEATDKNLELYVYYDPSLENSGMRDTAWNQGKALLAQDKDKCSALIIGEGRNSERITDVSSGFYQISDGLEQLRRDGKLSTPYSKAENGNVVQMAKIVSTDKKSAIFTLSLGFGNTPQTALDAANNSLRKGFDNAHAQFVRGWNDYVKTLRQVEPKYQAQFNMAAMQLKAHEDKTHRGANIASLSVPWGGGENANENNVAGYHLVWSRDLYQVATAFMALGDKDAAIRALDFLFKVQQKPDGSFPQNSFLDGKPFWGSLQMDEVAYPLIMAYQLGRSDKATWENHVKRAADFIVKNGPKTPQERWEEEAGFSPSTIAAEIAGLVCAAEIARKNGDETSANLYLKTADEWEANIERWTATTTGKYGDGNYYLRITQNGNPDAGEKIELNNGAGFFDEREIVDAGFLELVRLGIKSPDDPLIQKSLKVIDRIIKVDTPNGEGFYRYNHDGYGEMDDGRRWNWDGKYTGKGRLWVLLSGERGQYELALANNGKWKMENGKSGNEIQNPKSKIQNQEFLTKAKTRLDAMLGFANDGLMIPEQVWDKPQTPKNIDKQFIPELKFGEGTGSATPLAWSMAQFIRLAVNLQAGRNLDTPDVVYNRYVLGKKSEVESQNTIDKTINNDCENAQNFRPEGNGTMSEPRKDEPSPRLFVGKKEKESEMLFTYFGTEKSVEIAGDFTGWKLCGLKFQDFPNSKILVLKFPNSARVEYKLIVDGKWITDPLNPNRVDNGVGGENSFFTMPEYKATDWDKETGEAAKLDTLEIDSKIYGKRTVKIYVPKSSASTALPTLYLQDGSDYLTRAKAVQIQENVVRAGKIKPFIMVLVDYKDRAKEYWASDDYARFLATEVVPAIDAKYNTIESRDGRAILGASLGGITSVWTGLKYPGIFSRIGGQSSSFWVDNQRVIKELEKLDATKTPFRFYFDAGTLEGVENSRRVNVGLRAKGFPVAYEEDETGHNWTAWRDRLDRAFTALWK
ncbi:MAG: glycoside hydrolase family 15 protein [Acidobacteriota bacterium]|nr:glycoside hydrolase family 15 protein [Acidobacteriota bacterium]